MSSNPISYILLEFRTTYNSWLCLLTLGDFRNNLLKFQVGSFCGVFIGTQGVPRTLVPLLRLSRQYLKFFPFILPLCKRSSSRDKLLLLTHGELFTLCSPHYQRHTLRRQWARRLNFAMHRAFGKMPNPLIHTT